MVAPSDLGARPPGEEIAGSLLVQATSPDQGAGADATEERISSLPKHRSLLEQFLHNLMLALGGWPI